MVTLHEMSYSLFEMKPIPYDLFMATFGKSNYTQIAAQTFDDGVTEEIQTEDIECNEKWTQHPVEFSNHDIYLKCNDKSQKYNKNSEDYLTKFTFLINKQSDEEINNMVNEDKNYKTNPLRVYFEQKDGAGDCAMLPYESYEYKLKNNNFDVNRLSKFLKKVESRVGHVLNINTGIQQVSDLKKTKFPFSKGYVSLTDKDMKDEKMSFVKNAQITSVVFSDSKNNCIMTVHKKCSSLEKCMVCLWDLSVASKDPIKILTAVDNVAIGRFKGNTDGIFVAALVDG